MIKKTLSFSAFLVAVCLGAGVGVAQQDAEAHEIIGYGGTVIVLPNAERLETTVALTLNFAPEGHSNQIVFHLQASSGGVPSAWRGPAHVLSGDGLVAVLPDNQSHNLLFMFSNTHRPASLDTFNFDEYRVYGIARYGEGKPLTPDEIEQLARNGRVGSASTDFNPNAVKLSPDNTPDARVGGGGPYCLAGGPGANRCSYACSVTCNPGYYACCTPGVCFCVPQ